MQAFQKIHSGFKIAGKSFSSPESILNFVEQDYPDHYDFLRNWFDDCPDIEVYTSGSTGAPKKIVVQKVRMLNSAQKTIRFFDLKPQTKALLNLSSDFIAGKLMWVRALTGGWNLFVSSPKNQSIAQILKQHRFHFGAMVPLQVHANLKSIDRIDKLIIGGGAVSTELKEKLQNKSNHIFATYGMTETLTHIAVKPLNRQAALFSKIDSLDTYRVLEGVEIHIDKRGCLVVEAPGITEQRVITNDLVQIIDDRHFKWLGRYDNVVNSGGVKLIPEQIEAKLSSHIFVPFFVTGIPDEKLGEKLILVVEAKSYNLPDFQAVLNKYEIPKEVFFINRFVRTGSDKIKRKESLKLIGL